MVPNNLIIFGVDIRKNKIYMIKTSTDGSTDILVSRDLDIGLSQISNHCIIMSNMS